MPGMEGGNCPERGPAMGRDVIISPGWVVAPLIEREGKEREHLPKPPQSDIFDPTSLILPSRSTRNILFILAEMLGIAQQTMADNGLTMRGESCGSRWRCCPP